MRATNRMTLGLALLLLTAATAAAHDPSRDGFLCVDYYTSGDVTVVVYHHSERCGERYGNYTCAVLSSDGTQHVDKDCPILHGAD